MRADLALIFFLLSLGGGIVLLALRKKRGCAGAVSGSGSAAGAGCALKKEKKS